MIQGLIRTVSSGEQRPASILLKRHFGLKCLPSKSNATWAKTDEREHMEVGAVPNVCWAHINEDAFSQVITHFCITFSFYKQ